MGCTSSTEIVSDPYSGKETKKKRLGGSYPGQRRPQHQPYTPPEESFQGGNSATAHFVAYGGGNALTLARPDGTAIPPAQGPKEKEYVQVTLPNGVKAGDTIHVQSPSGKTNAIVIPSGFGPGSTFTVEFQDEQPAPTKQGFSPSPADSYNNNNNNNSNVITPPPDQGGDDGFASGFNNPHWRPTQVTAVRPNEPDIQVQADNQTSHKNYPSATAFPVYSA